MQSNKPLDDEAIGVLVDSKIKEATNWYGSKLSLERERVTRYYNGEYPKRQSPASSTYVSTEVYDSVEAMKAQLLETFAGGHEIVKFDAYGPNDTEQARIETCYADHVVFRQNDGYNIFSDVLHDGLTTRVGVAKVFWETKEDWVEEEFDGLDEMSVQGLAAQEDITELDAERDEATGAYSGTLTRKIDASHVRIQVINPESFSIEPQARALDRKHFCVHQDTKTIEDLEREGYDVSKIDVENLEEDLDLNLQPEVLARFQQTDSGFKTRLEQYDDGIKHVLVSEAYMQLRRKGDKHIKLYKVVRVGKVTLDIEEVNDLPFVAFVPIPVPHSFYGNNYAERVIPTQNVRTTLIRSVIDHAAITNNPRLQVVKGGLTNPRELIDNRLGGIVNVTRPDAVLPMPQAPLNPYVYQTLELLKGKLEETTGISSLSQGLNKDAVSNQNSQGMINDLVNLSQTRQKIIARNFANGFLVPLYLKVMDLVIAKEKRKNIVEVAGNWVEIDPTRFRSRKSATISLHLGYGELDREADKRIQMAALMAQDPQLNQMFGAPGRYKYALDIGKMRGVPLQEYLTPPDKLPPPQPDPFKVKEMENESKKADASMLTAQAAQHKIDMHGAIEQMRASLQKMQQSFDNNIKVRDADRKDADIAHKIDIGQRELTLLEEAPPEAQKAIISPN